MFGVVSQFVSRIWHGTPTGEDKNLKAEADNEIFSTKSRNENLHGAKFETGELEKVIFGKVTKIYDNSGLVDDEVYFTFDKVIGGIRPTLNAEVQVIATRASVHGGWRADRIEVLAADWDQLGDEGVEEVLIGDITDINENYLIVSDDTHCPMTSLAFGYLPCKGDWVRADVIRDRGLVCNVKVVKPLREKTLTGTVTSIGCGHGYVNTDIFFTSGACKRNYVPRKGHTVQVRAIESNQGNCKWRAVKIEPKVPRRETNIPNLMGVQTESKFTKKLLENKAGVVVTNKINFLDVTLGHVQETIIFIRNDGINSIILKSVDGLLEDSLFKISLIGQEMMEDEMKDMMNVPKGLQLNVRISPQSSIELKVSVNSRLLGEFNQLVVFNFGEFEIGRYFTANVRDKEQYLLDAKTPYHKRRFVDKKDSLNRVVDIRNNQQWVIPGERPMFKQKTINISTKLNQYEIPRTLRQYILNKMDLCALVPSLAEPLSTRNYRERFSALLHSEEVQMELEMREFDLQQVSLKPAGEFLSLAVPGLAKGRPSLLIGDRVILCVSGDSSHSTTSPKYEGFIHEVLSSEVLLKFHEDFHSTYDMDSYDVMFFFNRTTLRRCHKAVEFAKYLGDEVLFPTEVFPKLPQKSKKDTGLFNAKLNERQRAAVSRIVIGQSRPMPYVLFGPPGTGKTVTLVEAILQIFHRISSSRILACTPSNSAADLITERLHHSGGITEGDMVRLNAFQRQQNIPEDIENYSTNIEKLDIAAHYRIVICTCTTAGQLHTLGLAPGHFTHVIIDEAGQATEPESLVPISFLAGTEGQIILGGDPYQLGAVLRSPICQTYGLNISLLERLMTRTPYIRDETKFSNHGCYDPLAVTKLINNYRSHEALLELPSRLFYHAEMVPCADENVKYCLSEWDALSDGFPVLFHGVKGEDLREGNSPSWFNAVEAVQVVRYVQELRKFKKHPVKLNDIGIITPYRKQVEKIRLLLDRLGMSEIKVGSVEEFQGQERLVIIISTVRSRQNLIASDYTHNIGFLSNPKRFNVAITRAQALMIVIGNPHVLVQDTNWRALLQYCWDNKSYIGCDVPDLNSHVESDDYVESNVEGCEQSRSGFTNFVETLCNNVESAGSIVQSTSEESGHCFKNEVGEYVKSSKLHSEGFGQNMSQNNNSYVEDLSTSVRLVNDAQVFCKGFVHCFEKDQTKLYQDDKSQVRNESSEVISNNVFEPFLDSFNGNTESYYNSSIDDADGTPMHKLDTVKDIGGSRGDSGGVSTSEQDITCVDVDGYTEDNVCISMDKYCGGISMDNLDINGVSGVNEGGLSVANCEHNRTDRHSEPKIIEDNGAHIQDVDLNQSSKLDPSVEKINCFDKETPTRSVIQADNVDESSDEDLDEIVYKGEKE